MLKQRFHTKSEIERFLQELSRYEISQTQELYANSPQEYTDFALSLRESILQNILKNGDVGSTQYLLLYLLFAPLQGKIPQEEGLEPFFKTAKSHFLSQGLGEFEN